MKKIALITGITGQDGAYLSQFLIKKGYNVIGLIRNYDPSSFKGLNYLKITEAITFEKCDLCDLSQVINVLRKFQPAEIYNLAAQSSVSLSFKQPIGTFQFNTISVFNLLEGITLVNPSIKFYQASSSEMFGKVEDLPIRENTVFHPLSPYAISKASAHWITINYRESYDLFTCCGILFNHESYLRSNNFFVKKIVREAINIKLGVQDFLEVGNIDIKRDFGFAKLYVEAMWLMLQQKEPEDYIICSGKSILLRKIIEHIFNKLEIGLDKIIINKEYYRPTDILDIYGINDKAKLKLGWNYNLDFLEVLDIIFEEEVQNTALNLDLKKML